MIPLARDAQVMRWWSSESVDDDGDVTTTWKDTRIDVLVSVHAVQSTITQTEDGQVCEDIVTLLFALPKGCNPKAGDRLGPCRSKPTIHLRDVRLVNGQAQCTGVRL